MIEEFTVHLYVLCKIKRINLVVEHMRARSSRIHHVHATAIPRLGWPLWIHAGISSSPRHGFKINARYESKAITS